MGDVIILLLPMKKSNVGFIDEIKEILGKGTFGKVLKCKDTKYNDSVALKVIRKIDRYIDSAKIEADILKDVFDRQTDMHANYCVKMFSSFYHKGMHLCYVFFFHKYISLRVLCNGIREIGTVAI
jgi:serine/threonine protein kinase